MLSAGWPVGMGQRQNPFLQIPLHEMYHTGSYGIDSGLGMTVEKWEAMFGTQIDLLDWVESQLSYCEAAPLLQLAWDWEAENRGNSHGDSA